MDGDSSRVGEGMKKKQIGILSVVAVVVLTLICLHLTGRLIQPNWGRQKTSTPNRAVLIAMMRGLQMNDMLPPKEGFTDIPNSDSGNTIRLQYINGKPAVIAAGKDNQFGSKDDLVCFYEPNE